MGEVESSRETAVAAVKREQKAAALVVELTTMIKEQKSRINELTRSKQETVATLKVQFDACMYVDFMMSIDTYFLSRSELLNWKRPSVAKISLRSEFKCSKR